MDYGYLNRGVYFSYSPQTYPMYSQPLAILAKSSTYRAIETNVPQVPNFCPCCPNEQTTAGAAYTPAKSFNIDFQWPRIPSLYDMWMHFYGNILPIGQRRPSF